MSSLLQTLFGVGLHPQPSSLAPAAVADDEQASAHICHQFDMSKTQEAGTRKG
jgi:hypothetical protein